ncbi:hypothetical protein L1987_22620 [Smallanthus sonchifolius]|uniref:Uncharacterized protein n=1 Tax=Smallanthus sonchifolius TaxID=185202 RepID=A0ACB9IFY5_9ASTR|nr:hypothetical protein L1987_22620 [Smallanthus sonchifolius]
MDRARHIQQYKMLIYKNQKLIPLFPPDLHLHRCPSPRSDNLSTPDLHLHNLWPSTTIRLLKIPFNPSDHVLAPHCNVGDAEGKSSITTSNSVFSSTASAASAPTPLGAATTAAGAKDAAVTPSLS